MNRIVALRQQLTSEDLTAAARRDIENELQGLLKALRAQYAKAIARMDNCATAAANAMRDCYDYKATLDAVGEPVEVVPGDVIEQHFHTRDDDPDKERRARKRREAVRAKLLTIHAAADRG